MPTYEDTAETKTDLFDEIMDRYKSARESWRPIFDDFLTDLRFADGEQWDSAVKTARQAAGLSTLVYDQIESKIKYIVNNARANTPAIKCSPVDNGASKNTAKIFDGLIKHLQYKHDAKHAYIQALKGIVTGGIGAWRVTPIMTADGEYDIDIVRVTDPTTVIIDPSATKQDFSDARYCFILVPLTEEQYAEQFGKDTEVASVQHSAGSSTFDKDVVYVLEYWCLNTETGLWEQRILSGKEILAENTEYRGKYMPVVYLTGEETHIEGERKYKGIVRGVKDMQMLLNLAKSRTADYMAKAAAGQWLVEADMISDYTDFWLNADVNGVPVLLYKSTTGGKPDRVDAPAPPVGFQAIASEADADIRANIGIRDPLQDVPASQSGKAIALQISQGNIGTFAFMDKLNSAIKYTGTVLLDLIPQYFSYAHIREIMGVDNQLMTVPLNQPYEDNGEIIMHDLTRGRYSVLLSEGPSYESQRTEASDKLIELTKIYPAFLQLAGDIIFRNMDFVGADEIADRLRSQIPPEVLAASSSSNADSKQQLAMAQNQARQMQQGIQQLQMQLQQAQSIIQQLQQEKQARVTEIQTKGQVDAQQSQLDHQHAIELKHLDIEGKGQVQQLKTIGDIEIDRAQAEANLAQSMASVRPEQSPRESAPAQPPVAVNIML